MSTDGRLFQLFAGNVPVRGACNSIICDLQRADYYHIPNDLYGLLTEHTGQSLGEIKEQFAPEDQTSIEDAFCMLVDNQLGFWVDGDAARFPPLDLSYERPETISNAIVDVNNASQHDYESIFGQLDELGCKHVELRFYDAVTVDELDRILSFTLRGQLRSVQLLLRYTGQTSTHFADLCERHARVGTIFVYGAPESRRELIETKWYLTFIRETIESADDCGKITEAYFATNVASFSEAQQFNSCLNKKVGVDVEGNIKNCPSYAKCYGDVATVPLKDVVRRDDFRRAWNIQRDQVEVCRDCEYRYICSDCRVFVSDPANPLSKPAKCGYDPYSGEWAS